MCQPGCSFKRKYPYNHGRLFANEKPDSDSESTLSSLPESDISDYSPTKKKRRRKKPAEVEVEMEVGADEADEVDEVERAKKKRNSSSPKKPRVTHGRKGLEIKASIVVLAMSKDDQNKVADIEKGVLTRIKKALAMGMHDTTGETEAKQAMRIAFQLMAQYNVSQADILASENASDQLKRAGQSCVELRSTVANKNIRRYYWMGELSAAVNTLFDCKSYFTNYGDKIVYTFYGLCESTVAAAHGFELAFNSIMKWSERKKGKLIYRAAVATGLFDYVTLQREEEEKEVMRKEQERLERAKAEEEAEEKRRLERLKAVDITSTTTIIEDIPEKDEHTDFNPPTTFTLFDYGPVEAGSGDDSDSDPDVERNPFRSDVDSGDDDDIDSDEEPSADFQVLDGETETIDVNEADQMLQDLEKKKKRKEKEKEAQHSQPVNSTVDLESQNEENTWASQQQLTLFKKTALKIADDWLKESDTKLSTSRAKQQPKLETPAQHEVWDQGIEDSKKIDLKRKRIREFGEEDSVIGMDVLELGN